MDTPEELSEFLKWWETRDRQPYDSKYSAQDAWEERARRASERPTVAPDKVAQERDALRGAWDEMLRDYEAAPGLPLEYLSPGDLDKWTNYLTALGKNLCAPDVLWPRTTERPTLPMLDCALRNLLDAAGEAQCSCTLKERDSGHRVGCWMPDLTEAIAAYAAPTGDTP